MSSTPSLERGAPDGFPGVVGERVVLGEDHLPDARFALPVLHPQQPLPQGALQVERRSQNVPWSEQERVGGLGRMGGIASEVVGCSMH